MPSIRSLLLIALPIISTCTASPSQPQPTNHNEHPDEQPPRLPPQGNSDYSILSSIIECLPEETVEAALQHNLAGKYREGVFEHGKKAIEAVHSADPELATKMVGEALVKEMEMGELRKRQNETDPSTTVVTTSSTVVTDDGGETSTVVTTDTTTSTEDNINGGGTTTTTDNNNNSGGGTTTEDNSGDTTTATGVIVPVTQTTTNEDGNTVTSTTSAFQQTAATSTVVAITTTNSDGSEITSSATVPAALVTTTNAQGETITSASRLSTAQVVGGTIVGDQEPGDAYTTTDRLGNSVVLSGTREGQVITTTDARGRIVVLTYHPGGGQVSELVIRTTDLPGGGKSTITSFAEVGGTRAAEGTGRGRPGLQSGVASPTARYAGEIAALVGGAMGVAAVLL